MEILGIKFAPLNVPLKRRVQTLSIAVWVVIIGFGIIWSFIITTAMLYYSSITRYIVLLYCVWMYYDWDTCNRGGRSERWTKWFRSSAYLKNLTDYFPTTVEKTADLDPNKSYLLCSVPHGVLSMGVLGFIKYESRFRTLFPGIEVRAVILDQHFRLPFAREYCYMFSVISCSPESLNYRLSSKPPPPYTGMATVLVVGGAFEALESIPGTYRTVIKKRKGFVKLALKHGTSLVPVIPFGEPDTYDQVHAPMGSRLRRVQEYIRNKVGVAPVIVIGRGFFQYSFGLIPRRTPITVVIGSPLDLPKIEEPTNEQIDEYHQKFIDSLVQLFEAEKHKYIKNADSVHLEFI
ncbi:2-acylglycerol O-acyltransferase 2-A [Xylocopa sonorina]|uniref:2-acylglycerol O-acyltransferase 2-A n=1 Tax=Xylocopa sonorina TaxID=1818115 RepID=UPI00403B225B